MDISYMHYALVGLATFVGESFRTIFGGGSFLIQPALLSVGFSPHIAGANDMTATVFSSGFFVLYSFRARKPDKQIMSWMLPGVTVGAFLGGLLMPHIPEIY
jgi:uncharacterized membrane protein YfcA